MDPQIQYCTTADGVSIAYARYGQGLPLITVPNLWSNIGFFYELFPERLGVGGANESILLDGRGTGASQREVTDISLETRLLDLDAVVERIGEGPYALMGVSHGGPPAIAYAARHPERVSHLLLMSTYASGAEYYAQAPVMRALASIEPMAMDQWDFYTKTAANAVLGYGEPELAERMAAIYRDSIEPDVLVRYREASRRVDVTALLGDVRCPTLVLEDKNSALTVPALSRVLASKIPGARLVSFEGGGLTSGSVMFQSPLVNQFLGTASDTVPAAAPAPTPSAFRAVLFSDLVDHTAMMQRLGDAAGREILREHERIVRDTLREFGGNEVKSDGDGFMVSFTSASAALDCAIGLQRAFAERNDSAAEPLHVRIGLNAGEPVEEEGDLFGASVILASRVKAMAGAGEILVPEPVRHLLAGKGYVFADRGEHVLKGFEDAVRVFEVRWQP
jgi:class 3 adenylate cyclase/pimeloyl-ACP methyl ester carboxylesterase